MIGTFQLDNMSINNATIYSANINATSGEIKISDIINIISDENKLGLGKSDIKFAAKPTVTEYDFAGKLDDSYKDMEEITGWQVTLDGDILDINEELLKTSCFKKVNDTNSDYVRYEPQDKIADGTYKDLIVVGEIKGKQTYIILVLYNTFNTAGLEITFKDKDNNAATLSYKARRTLDGGKSFDILIPKVAE